MTGTPAGATWHRGIDLIAVTRVLEGEGPLPELTEDELRYAVVVMTDRGLGAQEIADRLGVTQRTVVRWRREARGGAG